MVSGEWPSSFAFFASALRSLRLNSGLKTQSSPSETRKDRKGFRSPVSDFSLRFAIDQASRFLHSWTLNRSRGLLQRSSQSCRRQCLSPRRGREIIAQGKAVAAATLGYRGQNNLGACGARDRDTSAAKPPPRIHLPSSPTP